MKAVRATGPGAASRKYDILTALGAWGLAGSKSDQRLALRCVTLITARYDWQRDRLAVGQREIAALWNCTERTVKREMARLRALGWFRQRRPGARGRVAEYGLNIELLLEATRAHWPSIGPDFVLRLDAPSDEKVVPFSPKAPVARPQPAGDAEWDLAAALLYDEDPSTYGAWLQGLRREGRAGAVLTLRAPSRFHGAYVETHLRHRLLAACRAVDPSVERVLLVF
ncbi:MAG: hypothetical protein AAF871_09060 [Pseudomonadota bacterium]